MIMKDIPVFDEFWMNMYDKLRNEDRIYMTRQRKYTSL